MGLNLSRLRISKPLAHKQRVASSERVPVDDARLGYIPHCSGLTLAFRNARKARLHMFNYPATKFIADNELESDDLIAELCRIDVARECNDTSSKDVLFTKGLVIALPISLFLWSALAATVYTIF